MKKSFDEIFSELEWLLKNYSNELRNNVQPFRYETVKQINPNYKFNPEDRLVRENLIEHVGSLSVLAVFFHAHITEPVNLGRVLEMLAVHDIGETVIGDESTFTKNSKKVEAEKVAADFLIIIYLSSQFIFL